MSSSHELGDSSSSTASLALRFPRACLEAQFKGAVSRNSAKLGNYKMPVKLRET